MSDKPNPIETIIDGYKAFALLYLAGTHQVAALLTAQQADTELARLRSVIEAAQEYMEVMEAIGANKDNAVRQSYIELQCTLQEAEEK